MIREGYVDINELKDINLFNSECVQFAVTHALV